MKTIPLRKHLRAGALTEIQIRTLDKAGDLRGIKLSAIQEFDVDTILVVLKRLLVTPLTPDELTEIGPADLVTIAGEVADFFR